MVKKVGKSAIPTPAPTSIYAKLYVSESAVCRTSHSSQSVNPRKKRSFMIDGPGSNGMGPLPGPKRYSGKNASNPAPLAYEGTTLVDKGNRNTTSLTPGQSSVAALSHNVYSKETVIQAHVDSSVMTRPGAEVSFNLTPFMQYLEDQIQENKRLNLKLSEIHLRTSLLSLENSQMEAYISWLIESKD